MSNHYHLLLETPEPNLVAGMRWLQSTFANKIREHIWENAMKASLSLLEKSTNDLIDSRKGADWKVATRTFFLRESYRVPNYWLAKHLKMGSPSSVQSWVSRHHKNESEKTDAH